MEENIKKIDAKDVEILDEYYPYNDIDKKYTYMPEIAVSLLKNAKGSFKKIEKALYKAPAFIEFIKANFPKEYLQLVLTEEQKERLADGTLKLMTRKNGTLCADLINPKTHRIVAKASLEKIKLSPELNKAITDYSTQMQLAQIAEQIELVQVAVEEVRQGQENDRLAIAYSCEQKLLQANSIKNPALREAALLRIASDAEDCRNQLMLSQKVNVEFIESQPETFWKKLVSGAKPEKIDLRMHEIKESLYAVNIVSLAEAMCYQEMGETAAAQQSLKFYGDFIKNTYLDKNNLVNRLDLIDSATDNYWSNNIPQIEENIQKLPCNIKKNKGGKLNGRKSM